MEASKVKEHKEHISIALIGDTQSGKSTLLGGLMRVLDDRQQSQRCYERLARNYAILNPQPHENAWMRWMTDTLKRERENPPYGLGRTIMEKIRYLSTSKYRLSVFDASGIQKYGKQIPRILAFADYGLMVADASIPDISQVSLVHATEAFGLGIRSLIVAVSKMEATGYSEDRFKSIKESLLASLCLIGFEHENLSFVPVSSFEMENIAEKSTRMTWFKGKSLIEEIDALKPPFRTIDMPLVFTVFDSYKVSGVGTVMVGRVGSGAITLGQFIGALEKGPNWGPKEVKSLEHRCEPIRAGYTGDIVGVNIKGVSSMDIKKKVFMVSDEKFFLVNLAAEVLTTLKILEVSMKIRRGFNGSVHCNGFKGGFEIQELVAVLDEKTGQVLEETPEEAKSGRTYSAVIRLFHPTPVLEANQYGRLGRFILRSSQTLVAYGIVDRITKHKVDV